MNKRLLPLFLISSIAFAQTAEEYRSFLSRWEGYRELVYIDTLGNPTVGIGHLIKGKCKMGERFSPAQINTFFNEDLATATKIAKRAVKDFDSLPKDVKLVVASLAFNLGSKLFKFTNFLSSLNNRDYSSAAQHLKDSLWYRQVGNRGKHHVKVFVSHG